VIHLVQLAILLQTGIVGYGIPVLCHHYYLVASQGKMLRYIEDTNFPAIAERIWYLWRELENPHSFSAEQWQQKSL
jgi:hypothetical protein